jgi:hypothetical protein
LVPGGLDGRHITYLALDEERLRAAHERVRVCDAALYDAFRAHLRGAGNLNQARSILELQRTGTLPPDTLFHANLVVPGAQRQTWFADALAMASGASIVFCDPDNGLANPGSAHDYPCSEEVLASATPTEEGIELTGSKVDFESLAGWVAGDANHADRRARRKIAMLHDLWEQLETAIESRSRTW